MEWFDITFKIYRKVFSQALTLTAKNWPVLGSLFVYWALLQGATLALAALGVFHGPLALVGGLALTLLRAACLGSFLYLVEMVVRTGRASFEDFQRSFTVYLGDVIGVMFVFWVISLLTTPIFAGIPQGWAYFALLQFVLFVFFNAVPELIYLGHFTSLALLGESYKFIGANWIEWFPPTVIAVALGYVLLQIVRASGIPLLGDAVLGLVIYFTMVLRGLLFVELYNTSYRARAFRHRASS